MTDLLPEDRYLAEAASLAGLSLEQVGLARPGVGEEAPDGERILTGWERVDLSLWLDGTAPDDSPQIGRRTDGVAILYPGKVHALNGEPESGKSWVAQHLCAQVLTEGGTVLYLDFEDTPKSIVARLLALGVRRGDFERLWYHRLDQPLTLEALVVLEEALAAAEATLAVCDGVTEAMALCALNPYDLHDVAKFWATIPRRLAKSGAAGVLIDHVVKDREARGRWAIGSEHKMAAIDGAAFTVEAVKPFGRNKEGMSKLLIEKDRPGWLRQHANGKSLAQFILRSWPDGNVDASLVPCEGGDETFRPTVLMERISRYIEDHPGLGVRALRAGVKGDNNAKDLALELLVSEGFVERQRQGNQTGHYSTLGFREPREETREHEDF